MRANPPDAVGTYAEQVPGERMWIKDITGGHYPMGRLWSNSQDRWRKKREAIYLDRVTTFEPQEQS